MAKDEDVFLSEALLLFGSMKHCQVLKSFVKRQEIICPECNTRISFPNLGGKFIFNCVECNARIEIGEDLKTIYATLSSDTLYIIREAIIEEALQGNTTRLRELYDKRRKNRR